MELKRNDKYTDQPNDTNIRFTSQHSIYNEYVQQL